MSKNVNPVRDANRQARNAAKLEAVKAFQAKYMEVVVQHEATGANPEDVAFEAVTESVAAYNAAYKATRDATKGGSVQQTQAESSAA